MLDASYYYTSLDVAWSVCVYALVMRQAMQKWPSRLRCRFGGQTREGSRNQVLAEYIWAPPGEYDQTICTMQANASTTAATCFVILFFYFTLFTLLSLDGAK